jgi:hypothetical protein
MDKLAADCLKRLTSPALFSTFQGAGTVVSYFPVQHVAVEKHKSTRFGAFIYEYIVNRIQCKNVRNIHLLPVRP